MVENSRGSGVAQRRLQVGCTAPVDYVIQGWIRPGSRILRRFGRPSPAGAGRRASPAWGRRGRPQKCIQARAEAIAKAPAFRSAFENKRCLVVVDGFYEWSGTGKAWRLGVLEIPRGKRRRDLRRRHDCRTRRDRRAPSSHDRMPLVLVVPVSTWVNDVRHEDPRCLDGPVDAAPPAQTTLRFG